MEIPFHVLNQRWMIGPRQLSRIGDQRINSIVKHTETLGAFKMMGKVPRKQNMVTWFIAATTRIVQILVPRDAFCEIWGRDKKVSLRFLPSWMRKKVPTILGKWDGRSEGQTVSRPNCSSSCSYFLMFLDQIWPYDIYWYCWTSLLPMQCNRVHLLHILSDYVSFPFPIWK
jgi:hypothetical protein